MAGHAVPSALIQTRHEIVPGSGDRRFYENSSNLRPEKRFKVLREFRPEDNAEEAEERRGETDSYKESNRRVSKYKKG